MSRQIRILVVEDEEAIRAGLIDVFVFHGYDVDGAATGPDGLEKALTGKFDLVLLDIMLPGIDGYEICDRIRTEDRHQAVIMLTAKTSDEEIIQVDSCVCPGPDSCAMLGTANTMACVAEILGVTLPGCASTLSDRKSTRLNSSHLGNSYAVFCLKKKKKKRE